MPELIEAEFNTKVREPIIPEFPFRRGIIYGEDKPGPNASVKVDYLVLSEDGTQAFFVELKTDQDSFSPDQDKYIDLAIQKGLLALIRGVLQIIEATDAKYLPKYMHLLNLLMRLGLISFPIDLPARVCVDRPPSAISWLGEIEPLPAAAAAEPKKVYIIPESKPGYNCISFEKVAKYIRATNSPLGEKFAQNLERWILKAGSIYTNRENV